jgi:hypothetical protein
MNEPQDWAKVKGVEVLKVDSPDLETAERTWTAKSGTPSGVTECIWPAYVPVPASEVIAATGTNDPKNAPSSGAVATADKHWAEATAQARSTAKWIATTLAAALAAVVGTAPLTSLNGSDVDWESQAGGALLVGIGLIGITLFMVISVLIPGVTTFDDLMQDPEADQDLQWMFSVTTVSGAQRELARKAKAAEGVLLPIGIQTLAELGHRVRLEELTLTKILDQANKAPAGKSGDKERAFWAAVRLGRAQILQGYLDEISQWVMVAAYVAVKVRADRARTFGLACGLAGAVAIVWGYVEIQPADPVPTAQTLTYIVLTADPTTSTRKQLGPQCDTFVGVPIEPNSGKTSVYVVSGSGCKLGRHDLPADEIGTVRPPDSSPTPTRSVPPTELAPSTTPSSS